LRVDAITPEAAVRCVVARPRIRARPVLAAAQKPAVRTGTPWVEYRSGGSVGTRGRAGRLLGRGGIVACADAEDPPAPEEIARSPRRGWRGRHPGVLVVMDFDDLVRRIGEVHVRLAQHAAKAVNVGLTLRNWLIGLYLHEFELRGSDRAVYGAELMERVSERLAREGLLRVDPRELRRFRQFYVTYPQIRESLPPESMALLPDQIRETLSPELALPGARILEGLSFSHLAELIKVDDPVKRTFYELQCLQGCWSVRELKRQIGSLYFERSGLSIDRSKLAALANEGAERVAPSLVVRDPYVFEFLGLKPQEVMRESELEDALLDKVQEFLLELGRGFCFEARQKRILIGGEHFFVDLVFYHRILKCHVLIELKVEGFSHESVGQLNTYVNWYREHEMADGDNPPVGILLCTEKNHALVDYALAGMDNRLFVSKYQLILPNEAEIRAFLEEQLRAHDGA
jgi:predicted nuclease of restriction endonuclease-like (RecB) superfamily